MPRTAVASTRMEPKVSYNTALTIITLLALVAFTAYMFLG